MHRGFLSPLTMQVMDILNARPAGVMCQGVAEELRLPSNRVSKTLQRLEQYGHIGGLREEVPGNRAGGVLVRTRYFAWRHKATARAEHEAGRNVVWGDVPKPEPKPAKVVAEPAAPWVGEIVPPRRPIDPMRAVSPVFSGLRPGVYPLTTGSAIERAYAGR